MLSTNIVIVFITMSGKRQGLLGLLFILLFVLSLNNGNFSDFLHQIYPVELVIKDTTDSPNSASYLDLYLEHDINGTLTTKLYDKCDDLTFLSSTIPFSTVTSLIREPVIPIRIFYIDLSC